ncbi:DUF443 domain-containing protein [Staphylococcus aureus]|uniref:Tandem five-TM family protein n=1 Tax=Staphylococcus aureus TaxID=1280 RepID=A0A8G2I061_STAAU|nr:DUF443 family protein [Staphylococcus aureus]EFB50568.1 conserved hypothetical protein [Staphylococcus aureus subsp. aureus D139]KIT72387.1 tandem five-TM protein [Staphylococcus aureus]MBZ5403142.1 DUF443 family protein [Staphylococcus aureus]MBZ5421556.1 DUF443 family protein [Staphylococcus aureus]MCB8116652.1 DUF443 family protein [Staphylococcus aureus]
MLCESWNINKNPRYKIIKYKNEFLMIDVTSSWIFFFIPMLNWGVPKKFAKISQSKFEELNTFTPKNSRSAGWIAGGGSVLLAVLTRKYIQLLNIQVNQIAVNILCCLVLLGVFLSALYINSKSKLNVYDRNNCDEKIILIPTFKNLCLMLLSYILFGGLSILAFYMFITEGIQNIILFITWIMLVIMFLLSNVALVVNKKVNVIKR